MRYVFVVAATAAVRVRQSRRRNVLRNEQTDEKTATTRETFARIDIYINERFASCGGSSSCARHGRQLYRRRNGVITYFSRRFRRRRTIMVRRCTRRARLRQFSYTIIRFRNGAAILLRYALFRYETNTRFRYFYIHTHTHIYNSRRFFFVRNNTVLLFPIQFYRRHVGTISPNPIVYLNIYTYIKRTVQTVRR